MRRHPQHHKQHHCANNHLQHASLCCPGLCLLSLQTLATTEKTGKKAVTRPPCIGFAGHSLGGLMAQLASLWISAKWAEPKPLKDDPTGKPFAHIPAISLSAPGARELFTHVFSTSTGQTAAHDARKKAALKVLDQGNRHMCNFLDQNDLVPKCGSATSNSVTFSAPVPNITNPERGGFQVDLESGEIEGCETLTAGGWFRKGSWGEWASNKVESWLRAPRTACLARKFSDFGAYLTSPENKESTWVKTKYCEQRGGAPWWDAFFKETQKLPGGAALQKCAAAVNDFRGGSDDKASSGAEGTLAAVGAWVAHATKSISDIAGCTPIVSTLRAFDKAFFDGNWVKTGHKPVPVALRNLLDCGLHHMGGFLTPYLYKTEPSKDWEFMTAKALSFKMYKEESSTHKFKEIRE